MKVREKNLSEQTFATEIRQLLFWCLGGLAFGFISGCIGMGIAYQETLPDPTQEHWFDVAVIFSCPGIMLTWAFFHPPDGYYGDIWDNRNHIVLLNGFSWMLIALFLFSLISIGRALLLDIRSFRRTHTRRGDDQKAIRTGLN